MKILITESQLKYLVVNEQSRPSKEMLYGRAPIAPIDGKVGGEFRNWLIQNFYNTYSKYSKIQNWDTNTTNQIRNEYEKNTNVGKSWDAEVAYKKESVQYNQQQQQQQQAQIQKAQQQAQQKQLQKTVSDYQAKEAAKTDKFVSKQDVLDPRKIEGSPNSYNYQNFCVKWSEKYPNKPCPEPNTIISEDPLAMSPTTEMALDVLAVTLQFFPPFGTVASKVIEVVKYLYYTMQTYRSKTTVDQVTYFISSIFELISLTSAKIPISPSVKPIVQKIDNYVGSPAFRELLTGAKKTGEYIVDMDAFGKLDKFTQCLTLVAFDVFGPKLYDGIIEAFQNYLQQLAASAESGGPSWLATAIKNGDYLLRTILKFLGVAKVIKPKIPTT
jgi:hypothetical protein